MKKYPAFMSLAALALVAAMAPVHAAVLVSYTFASAPDPDTTPNPNPATTIAGGSGSAFTVSGGINAAGGAVSGSSDMAFLRGDSLTTGAAEAFTAGDYFEFTFTPDVGATFDLTSIAFSYGGSNNGTGSSAFTASYFIRTDAGANADNFSTDLGASFAAARTITGGGTNNQLGTGTFTFTGGGYGNLSTPVTFRIYTFTSDQNNGKINRIDTVTLNGTLIPEPGVGLLALVAAGTAALRRQRR